MKGLKATKAMQPVSRRLRKRSAQLRTARRFVGTWRQVPNSFHTSTVVYSVTLQKRGLLVTGVDRSNGVELKIHRTRLLRGELRFTSYFPPTKHTATHACRLLAKRWMLHQAIYKYRGHYYGGDEVWERVRP